MVPSAINRIINQTQQTFIAEKVHVADTAWSRIVGLLNRETILPSEALIITQCRSIHMLFMRFSIDVIFVDRAHRVIGLVQRIKPFHLSPYFFRSAYCVELPEGTIETTGTMVGDQLFLETE